MTSLDLIPIGLTTDSIYQEALSLVGVYPENIGLRDFALKVGRSHNSRGREDRKPTIYDEQAIRDDLMVHIR